MTNHDHISSLDDGTRTTRAIADIVGCHVAYVRAVRQREKGSNPMMFGDLVAANIAARESYRGARDRGLDKYAADLVAWKTRANVLDKTGRIARRASA